MPTPDTHLPILAAVLHGLVALTWLTLALSYCKCHGTARPQSPLLKLFRLLGWLFAGHYFSKLLLDLVLITSATPVVYSSICSIAKIPELAILPVIRHLVALGTLGSPPPSRSWLAVSYGSCLLALAGLPFQHALPIDLWALFLGGFTALVLWDLILLMRARRRPILMADLGFGRYLALSIALFIGVLVLIFLEPFDATGYTLPWILSDTFIGLIVALPFALRVLPEVARGLILNGLRGLGVTIVYVAFFSPAAPTYDSATFSVLAISALVGLVALGSNRLSEWVDAVVFRHSRQWRHQLRHALYDLSPETGVRGTCSDAVASLADILRIRGLAVLLDGDPKPVVWGRLHIDRLVELWPTGRALSHLPHEAYDLLWLEDVELQTAMLDAGVSWVVPIVSPRRRWGQLFVSSSSVGHGKLSVLEDFAAGLALVLDAADLLHRARDAERDLARSEKLAALGETAARIAHEIRNPVTAARSLSQQIAAEPVSPLNEEHAGLVVRELDRVERQVRSLLQFAHQESYGFGVVRLDTLIESTVADLQSTGIADQVDIQLELEPRIEISADGERLRQVLVNLISNAIDAVRALDDRRQVRIDLGSEAGAVELAVSDNGPGIEDELLQRLFDPFVSAKAQGTGLGLAISKRIVEAHGGCIRVERGDIAGLVFHIRLPENGPDGRHLSAHETTAHETTTADSTLPDLALQPAT